MRRAESLNHSRWECKYHIVFIPKYRRKRLFGAIRKELVEVFRRLARQKECEIEEGHLMPVEPDVVAPFGGARSRQAPSIRRFERLTIKAPGFAGGYLLNTWLAII